ncbi:Tuberous sclerosis 2-like protein [Steccherinum ochraceum]|uniref:Tuberous sclerosis 2-like protein n=1 Tax=Steccherinum ochraceum TaxID=92696 RepID=A0A4V2MVJ6_9APHY|nr:Tuberous sclerosis 2-like protein [Steccherinum ochraceum]
MSRLNDDSQRPIRPRANTSSFAPFIWRRGRAESSLQTSVEPVALSSEALLEALSPPAVPSLNHAKALAVSLTGESPKPRLASLIPVITVLCASESPSALQVAGFDILAAYWAHTDTHDWTTADRLSCLSLVLSQTAPWTDEIWEPRFRALTAFTRSGTDTVGMERSLLRVLGTWIQGAFAGIVEHPSSDDRLERQRSIDIITKFHLSVVAKHEFVARLSSEDVAGVLQLYGGLVDQALSMSSDNLSSEMPSPLSPPVLSPFRLPLRHTRSPSTNSVPSVAKHPVDLAVDLFLNYLHIRLNAIAPDHLSTIVPYLFRALSWYVTPLPRLSLNTGVSQQHPVEKRATEVLDTLVTGSYAASCAVILKRNLFPLPDAVIKSSQTTLGALRTLRSSIRRTLVTRLARSYITRTSSAAYTISGAPSGMDLGNDLMERAWSKDDVAVWGLSRFRSALCNATRTWLSLKEDRRQPFVGSLEAILNEIAGVVMDLTHALEEAGDGDDLDEDELDGIKDILTELVGYILSRRVYQGVPISLDLKQGQGPSPFLSTIAALLAPHLLSTPLYDVLASVTITVAPHLTDADVAQLLIVMQEHQSLSPTSPKWLEYWAALQKTPELYSLRRPLSRHAYLEILQSVWDFVKDIPMYRRPLGSLLYTAWLRYLDVNPMEYTSDISWRILADEAVLLLSTDGGPSLEDGPVNPDGIVELLQGVVFSLPDKDTSPPAEESVPSTPTPIPTTSISSPIAGLSPTRSEAAREIEASIPSVMSILSSFTSGGSSRSQSQQPRADSQSIHTETAATPVQDQSAVPRAVGAVIALISIFSQCTFTSLALSETHRTIAIRVFNILVNICSSSPSTKARISALQFLMRLRVDRDHRLYYVSANYDESGNVASLASCILKNPALRPSDMQHTEEPEGRQARPRFPQERHGRPQSRGPGRPSTQEASRSRSRAPSSRIGISPPTPSRSIAYESLWAVPESLPFAVTAEADTPSEGLSSYDPTASEERVVLPLSSYLAKMKDLLMAEKDWEVLSYILCHLPTQLANKHLFCGPKSKLVIANLLASLCGSIVDGRFGSTIGRWPEGVLARDAQGLAYHTITVLISYKQSFKEPQLQHRLVEVFLAGLNSQPSIKTCLHGLSLSAFELQPSMTKHLPRILEKLSQIMSNPAMAVHIIDFLSIVGSLPVLHGNFTDADYKMVFGVALQYLQQHNRADGAVGISWALSQHVRIMSYYIVYLWFLAVKLPDRPHHVKYITRQLLLANDGKEEVDEPAEVCFDWLARYTYASADPRPATSMLSEIITDDKANGEGSEPALTQKTWIYGNSVVTIRALARRGWLEVLSRRASGLTKFLCRAENIPLVTPGDVDPDIVSLSLGAVLNKRTDNQPESPEVDTKMQDSDSTSSSHGQDEVDKPDPITGYVWSGTAPSQRRKEVSIDPSYFALQLSSYPDSKLGAVERFVVDPAKLPSFFRTLDRMPVIDTHKVGIMYVAPGQNTEQEILRNTHGSPAYTRFLEGLGRLINLRGQLDVYAGGLDPDEDGEYAYAWWDDIGQILYHTATLMPPGHDDYSTNKKRHIGNDYVRIVWNDSGAPYDFETLSTQFQFVNIVIEPHSRGAVAAFSNNVHENEYFKLTVQRAAGMTEFTPIGDFKLISAEQLPLMVRQLSLLSDWFVSVYQHTQRDTVKADMTTNWRSRLQAIKRFKAQVVTPKPAAEQVDGIVGQEAYRDFTTSY